MPDAVFSGRIIRLLSFGYFGATSFRETSILEDDLLVSAMRVISRLPDTISSGLRGRSRACAPEIGDWVGGLGLGW